MKMTKDDPQGQHDDQNDQPTHTIAVRLTGYKFLNLVQVELPDGRHVLVNRLVLMPIDQR